jgi:Brp/Blh family beta-carotene 15,15'-monooxygenase
MNKLFNFSIVASFIGLWIVSKVNPEFEIILGFLFIFSFGVLHGSNDILLILKLSSEKYKRNFFKVIALYVLTIIIAIVLFYVFPSIGLMLFILFSAFHFGEQNWEPINLNLKNIYKKIFYTTYGLFILFLLFKLNTNDVLDITASILSSSMGALWIDYVFLFTLIFLIVFFAINLIINKKKYKIFILEIFKLLIFAIIFEVSTLIWGFTIYFILWHSIPSLFEQITYIYGNFNKENATDYVKKAFPYWLISIIGLVVLYLVFNDNSLIYTIFFSFIAAITFPHTIVINRLFRAKK